MIVSHPTSVITQALGFRFVLRRLGVAFPGSPFAFPPLRANDPGAPPAFPAWLRPHPLQPPHWPGLR